MPGDGVTAVTIIGWHGTALGCRRRGLLLLQTPAPAAN